MLLHMYLIFTSRYCFLSKCAQYDPSCRQALKHYSFIHSFITKLHTITTSEFWLIKSMDANFFHYSIYDRFIQRQPCACLHACLCAFVNFFFKKISPQKLFTGLFPNFIVVFLRQRLKSSLHRNRKIRPVEQYRRSSASS